MFGCGSEYVISLILIIFMFTGVFNVWNSALTNCFALFQIVHPPLDTHSVLMVQLFGVDMFYRPSTKHDKPGLVKSRDGPLDELGDDALLGWAVVPVFKQCVSRSAVEVMGGSVLPTVHLFLRKMLTSCYASDTERVIGVSCDIPCLCLQ